MPTPWCRRFLLGSLVLFVAGAGEAQRPIPLDDFTGWESWPLVRPGDLDLSGATLQPVHIEFDGLFPGPRGFGSQPLDSLTMWMDLLPARFHGRAAYWVTWTSSGPRPPREEAPAIDAILVERRSFRLLFRLARSGPASFWAGRYEYVQAAPDSVVQVTVDDSGTTSRHALGTDHPLFEFASYPFLFPWLELRAGNGMRLAGYDYLDKKEEILAVRVVGRVTIPDARGVGHEVWRVDVMPAHRATLISFFVAREPPYFYGWDYRLTRDGSSAVRLTLRGWLPTSIAPGAGQSPTTAP
jgi:hypothetical protein